MPNYSYFFSIIKYDEKVLPKDLRKLQFEFKINDAVTCKEIQRQIDKVFLCKTDDNNVKNIIQEDISCIIEAIINNEQGSTIILLSISRFSLVFKIGTKVLKIGFPKITYEFPDSNIILDSIIRKQYNDNNGIPIIFIEVQDLKENDLRIKYQEKEIDELIYQAWKTLRKDGIVWYDPKDKNVVINDKLKNTKIWNDKYYQKSSREDKGIYKLHRDKLKSPRKLQQ